MKGKTAGIVTAGILSGIALGGLINEIDFSSKYKPLVPIEVYDDSTKLYIKHAGGINEAYLNTEVNKYNDSLHLKYFSLVEANEREDKFIPIEGTHKDASIKSRVETVITMVENFRTINYVDNTPKDSLEKTYHSLKKLLNEINDIHRIDKCITASEKLEEIYKIAAKKIKSHGDTKDSKQIGFLANGNEGNCNDVGPAFYNLFQYYGLNAYMRFGQIIGSKGEDKGLHAWVSVMTEKGNIDLDPSWYSVFTPLEDRNPDIKYRSVKDIFIHRKK
jgi:hypothetical protein